MVFLSDNDWDRIFVFFVVLMRRPAQGATGSWVMPGFVSSGFLCVSSHYLILPMVSSLVAYGLGVSAPTPKAQGLISECGGEVFVLAGSWLLLWVYLHGGVFLG